MAKILICDDASFMRMTIKEMLENAGHEVVGEAEDGEDGFEKYKKLKPDLVTMDIVMKTSAIEAVKKIVEFDPKAKIIVVTVLRENEAHVVEMVKEGVLGIVTKPVKSEVLIGEVERVLKK